ncbi:hypothetical protein [Streptomyces endophytica]|uniref:Uncharacterized protein n=1 Tax=Streptomyces endophytica TaxID=2991496 RepID=A0ABY6PA40_9ACTN|nr:hypothetical protein [Streptomyces endophytica]UZJ30683.1 hypothetical protein OJ254_10340 [Streptomyces endophytica]
MQPARDAASAVTVAAATATRDSARPAGDRGTDGCAAGDREAHGCTAGGCGDGTGGSGGRATTGADGGVGDGEGR